MTALQKIEKHKWMISIALNIIALFVILLFFEITPKSDDYNMAQVLYGAYLDDEYCQFILYINPIIGVINKWLLQIFPNISWYYVFQYILMVASFSCILRIVWERVSTKCALIYWALMMPLCGYYFYSAFTFSKTAALLMVAGLLCLLYAIEKKNILFYVLGFLFVAFGILYRSSLFNMELVCFLPAFILEIKHFWGSRKNLVKTVLKFVVVVIGLFVIFVGARGVRNYMYANSEWSHYIEYNSLRANIADYPLLDFEEYSDLYQEYGITESDLVMWDSYRNILDMTEDDFESMNLFLSPAGDRGISSRAFFKTLFSQLCSNMMFYVFLIFLIFLLLSKNKDKRLLLICICGVMLTCIFVMYFRGRLQDHTNGAVLLACAMQFMYYADSLPDRHYRPYVLAGLIYVFAVFYNYASLTTSSYYLDNGGETVTSFNEHMADNYQNMSLLSDDKEHLYLIGARENNHIYQCFPAMTVIEKQFYSNIAYGLFGICNVLQEEVLDYYGLYTPYKDMVDNLDVFYCFTAYTDDEIDGITNYIRDEHGIECTPVLLKQAEKWSIYRYCSENLSLDGIEYIIDTDDVIYEINTEQTDTELDLSGYAYIEGEDSFAQNIYVLIEDSETQEEYYYYTLQTENELLHEEDKYNGKYSAFSAEINLSERDLQEYLIFLIFEINNNYYKIAVE